MAQRQEGGLGRMRMQMQIRIRVKCMRRRCTPRDATCQNEQLPKRLVFNRAWLARGVRGEEKKGRRVRSTKPRYIHADRHLPIWLSIHVRVRLPKKLTQSQQSFLCFLGSSALHPFFLSHPAKFAAHRSRTNSGYFSTKFRMLHCLRPQHQHHSALLSFGPLTAPP